MASLNFNHLRYFWAVAHDGNLTKAAAALGVSQSAVSVQIQKLEDRLGHALFERRGKQLLLTEAGRITLDHADTIFSAGEELLGTLTARESIARRILRVGSVSTLSRNFQLRFVQPLLGRGDVRIVMNSGPLAQLLAQLEAHRIDVLLTNEVPPRDTATPWISHQIAEQPLALVGRSAPGTLDTSLGALLASRPLVLPSLESGIRKSFDGLLDRLQVRPAIAAEVDDMAMLRLMVRADVGLGVVPPIVVQDELDAGHLHALAQLPGIVESFFAIVMKRRFPNPLLTDLLPAVERARTAD
ncbi:MAG: LysR family transcriptional regulator [Pseudomonadota bacterium]